MALDTMETTKKNAGAKHPLAGKQMMGAEMVVQVLSDLGVDTVFGYSGGAILPTYDAIFRHNAKQPETSRKHINLVVPANEQGAGFMAAGYSRSTGRVGVAIVTSGPGATNCVTPIRDCAADSVPMVLICGQVPRAAMGTDAFQEAPVFNIMSVCAKHTFLVTNPEELEATIRSAFDIATSGRPGPVVIDLPKDVQNWTGVFQGEGMLDFRGFEKRRAQLDATTLSDEDAASFFAMLAESERPLLYCGGGIINSGATPQLREFAKMFRIPVVTTLMGIGSVDTRDELSLHMLGMHGTAYANYAVEDCDFLIAAAARFDDRVAGKVHAFAPNAKNIAHLDIDAAEIGKVKNVTWSFVGDVKTGLAGLTAHGRKTGFNKDFSKWVEHIVELKKQHPLAYNEESPLIQPQEVIRTLSAITNGEAIVTTGVGQHQMWAAQYFDFVNPRQWLTSGSMGTMGFGLPSAIGAALACPDKTVICVDGDGSIRMNIGEMETATTYGAAVKILLLNNQGDGMVRQWQRLMFQERFSGTDKTMHEKDFVKAAEADGYKFAERLTDKAKLRETLERFVAAKGPAFLEVRIDPDAMVFPMVGPGASYSEMMVGPFIKPREKRDEKMGDVKADLF
ncbi:MAG: acetolactate synthase large subunit [Candidatus Sumerlaeota bacterium]|nr:acetolactate synthase large subunit [Candidatus Sumerlaeota bacterium]